MLQHLASRKLDSAKITTGGLFSVCIEAPCSGLLHLESSAYKNLQTLCVYKRERSLASQQFFFVTPSKLVLVLGWWSATETYGDSCSTASDWPRLPTASAVAGRKVKRSIARSLCSAIQHVLTWNILWPFVQHFVKPKRLQSFTPIG